MGDTLLGGGAGEYQRVPDHHGGVAVAEALRAGGIDTLFFLPGGHLAPVVNGCRQLGLRTISTRHESSAVFMAEAWARTTGRTGVAGVTAGPGFTNAVTGIANAQATGIPVTVLGGRTPLALRGRGAVQDCDQETVARAVAKWARTVTRTEHLGINVREALAVARSPRPGCTYLDLPTDVLTAEAPPFDGAEVPAAAPRADSALVQEAARLLAGAERPCVVAGGGAFWSGAGPALRRFAEATGIPVTTTSHARGLLPDAHPGCLGGLLHGGVGIALADVVLVVGSRFNGNLLFGMEPLWQPHHTIISIDADPAAFALNRPPTVGLLGDAATVLDQLTEVWAGESKETWAAEAKGYAQGSWDHWVGETEAAASGVHPGWAARVTCEFAHEQGPGATVVLDGGDALGWGLAFARAEQPGSLLFTSDALGTLGVGVPYAAATPLTRPDGPTVAFIGDGAFGLSAMEIETALRIGTAPIIVVSNNGSWGDVRYEETEWFGATTGTDLSPARYDQLCVALGGHGELVERPEDLRPALEKARAAGVVSVVNVITDPDKPNEVLRNMGTLNLQ